nr:MAG TPA: hypothetical protein [Caudoviricetes sp.]
MKFSIFNSMKIYTNHQSNELILSLAVILKFSLLGFQNSFNF